MGNPHAFETGPVNTDKFTPYRTSIRTKGSRRSALAAKFLHDQLYSFLSNEQNDARRISTRIRRADGQVCSPLKSAAD